MTGTHARGLVWGDDRRCLDATLDEALDAITSGEPLVWLHLQTTDHEEAAKVLCAELGLDRGAVADVLDANDRPYVLQSQTALAFSVLEVGATGGSEAFEEVGVFITERWIATLAAGPVRGVDATMDRLRAAQIQAPHPSELALEMVDAILDDYFPLIDVLEDEIESATDAVFAEQRLELPRLLRMKHRLLVLRRAVASMRDVINVLLRRGALLISESARDQAQDIYDHTLRLLDAIDLNRDGVTTLLDAHLSIESNRLNQVMRLLTVISTVLMSLALVAGVYGMNFRYMPELRWPAGYFAVLGLMVAIAVGEVWVFRRKGWL